MNDPTPNDMANADNERTRPTGADVLVSASSSPFSAFDAADTGHGQAGVLSVGSRLAEFEITALVGQGGFGAVYEARDHTLERRVAIKEYLPVSLSARQGDGVVQPLSERQRETFELGMRSFINEARLLAQFDHPSLLKVYRFWQERGTAYMAMPFYVGQTLRQALVHKQAGAGVREDWLLRIVDNLTQALAVMHRADCYHRDVAPDNILLLDDSGLPVLLDFGAARRVISNRTQAITVILKPGYAPVEQYAEMSDMTQGAWTDVYALAAVMHVAVTGRPPPAAVARLLADSYQPLAAQPRLLDQFSPRLLAAIDAGLAVRPEARPQSMDALRGLLGLESEASAAVAPPPVPPSSPASVATVPSEETATTTTPARAPSRRPERIVGALAALVVTAAGGWWGWSQRGAAPSVPLPPSSSALPAASPEPVPASLPEASAAVSEASAALPQASVPVLQASTPVLETSAPVPETSAPLPEASAPLPSAPASAPPFVPAATPPRSGVALLNALAGGASARFTVAATSRQHQMRIGKDKLDFELSANHAGYVYVYLLSSNNELLLLFPNALDKHNKIEAGQKLALPRKSWAIKAGGPPGLDRFAVLVSRHERDFSDSGIRTDGIFPRFHPPDAARDGGPPLLAGKPVCAPGAHCDDDYGVGMFEIDEK